MFRVVPGYRKTIKTGKKITKMTNTIGALKRDVLSVKTAEAWARHYLQRYGIHFVVIYRRDETEHTMFHLVGFREFTRKVA